MKSEFQMEMDAVVKPKLTKLGFHEVELEHCMCPEVLFNKDHLWFGASWDYRDRFLEVDLGRLFWFRDVMPRVVVLGDFATYCPELTAVATGDDLRKVAEFLRDSIENAILIYQTRYEEVLAERKNPEKLKYPKEFFFHLGEEVSKSDLEQFTAFSANAT